ncbi:MAG TPA: sulfite dehydrogenase [Dehalococcoidia bacterium]|nr:sulfite dehydrogenase [Dehalococcoidia bacterium]
MSQDLEKLNRDMDRAVRAVWWQGKRFTRRQILAGAAGAAAVVVLSRLALAQMPPDSTKLQGLPATEVSNGRSQFEQLKRRQAVAYAGIPQVTATDQRNFMGVITPSDLHFERHHNGIPEIDPKRYKLLIHGLVSEPKVFTLEDLKRLPQVSFPYFVECSGSSQAHWKGLPETAIIVNTHPLFSNSEWIGVPLQVLFREVGAKREARWFLVESYDGAAMTRSVPLSKGYDDGLIAYGQNGEAVRPEQGYPARLLLPGWEGNIHVKWIRRIELSDRPFMGREETAHYTDPYPREGKSRQFSMVWEAKSVITHPSPGLNIPGPGYVEILGLAWSGMGKVARVEVSTDGGKSWGLAALQEPILPKTSTRFRYPWVWKGEEAIILSRCTDETGYIQPTRNQLLQARGESLYHFNGIQAWKVQPDGSLVHVYHEPELVTAALPAPLTGPWPLLSDCGLV